jgi:HAD superfamily hydrolase (TIGR01548 family)
MGRKDAILFDIDGVLVDVRRSYIDSIRKTVSLYLDTILGVKARGRGFLTRADVDDFKLLGGFNNDWDAVYGLLLYFLGLIRRKRRGDRVLTQNELRRWKNIPALRKKLPIPCGTPLPSYELAKDMFQEIYLGARLFRKLYGRDPLFWPGRGLIHEETPLVPGRILAALRRRGFRLGVVTGRTAFEAHYVLRRFGIARHFSAVVTHDDVEREEKRARKPLRKPHPYSLLLCLGKLKARSFVYVGDLPDDVKAAHAAKRQMPGRALGFVYGTDRKGEMIHALRGARADRILFRPAELLDLEPPRQGP